MVVRMKITDKVCLIGSSDSSTQVLHDRRKMKNIVMHITHIRYFHDVSN